MAILTAIHCIKHDLLAGSSGLGLKGDLEADVVLLDAELPSHQVALLRGQRHAVVLPRRNVYLRRLIAAAM